jgi:hypothetical protein
MATRKMNPLEYLRPRDPATIVRRRGRTASTFYPDLVKAFMEAGEAAMDVNVAKIGRKPETVRSALRKAIRTMGVQDKVRVSMLGDEVVLIAR